MQRRIFYLTPASCVIHTIAMIMAALEHEAFCISSGRILWADAKDYSKRIEF
jgi:hypothetical protein